MALAVCAHELGAAMDLGTGSVNARCTVVPASLIPPTAYQCVPQRAPGGRPGCIGRVLVAQDGEAGMTTTRLRSATNHADMPALGSLLPAGLPAQGDGGRSHRRRASGEVGTEIAREGAGLIRRLDPRHASSKRRRRMRGLVSENARPVSLAPDGHGHGIDAGVGRLVARPRTCKRVSAVDHPGGAAAVQAVARQVMTTRSCGRLPMLCGHGCLG